jgi:release factor glutamine methyltransferase
MRVLRWTAERFERAALCTPRLDSELLLAFALGTDRVGLYLQHDRPLDKPELERIGGLVRRRLRGEPVAYLLGYKEFWSKRLAVDPRVLIPRADTEALVEVALSAIDGVDAPTIVDVGTGSGAVAIALASERRDARVLAVDIDEGAASVARENAARLGVPIAVKVGDLLAPLERMHLEPGSIDLVVSNPPYLSEAELAAMAPELTFEPRRALDGGGDGLSIYRSLVTASAPWLREGGAVAVEVGATQSAAVVALLAGDGRYTPAATARDLAGIERVVHCRRGPAKPGCGP